MEMQMLASPPTKTVERKDGRNTEDRPGQKDETVGFGVWAF